jgi:hypothetical protein
MIMMMDDFVVLLGWMTGLCLFFGAACALAEYFTRKEIKDHDADH